MEVNGPVLPHEVSVAPNTIREMAKQLALACVKGSTGWDMGGYITLGMEGLADFIGNAETNIHTFWREYIICLCVRRKYWSVEQSGDLSELASSTAFLSVTITNRIIRDCPPNTSTQTAEWCILMCQLAASTFQFGSRQRKEMAERITRFRTVEIFMERCVDKVALKISHYV